ncbi:MAG: RidA family protein [Rhizobiaceae bacterium]|nr:RidA family protein [Rhizobiaceae bacterium]
MAVTSRRERVRTPSVPEPAEGLWSNCLRTGDTVYIAGLVAYEDGRVIAKGAEAQADYIFSSIKSYMESAGGQMADLVTMTIYLTDIADRPAVLNSRRRFFTGDFPCSTLIAVSALIDPDLVVEINAIGVIGSSKA